MAGEKTGSESDGVCHVAGLSDFKRQCGKDYVDESLREAICCRVSVRIQSKMESRWKADGVFRWKLDLPDEVIARLWHR